MKRVLVALLFFVAARSYGEDCFPKVFVTFAPTQTEDAVYFGPFAHVQQGVYGTDSRLKLLVHPYSARVSPDAPLIEVAYFDPFDSLWHFDHNGETGSRDTVVVTPYDIQGNGILCVPAARRGKTAADKLSQRR